MRRHCDKLRMCDASFFDICDLKFHVSVKTLTAGSDVLAAVTMKSTASSTLRCAFRRGVHETSGSPRTWCYSPEDRNLQWDNCLHFSHAIKDACRILIMYLQAS
jgi:hypothetical protein